MSFEREQHEERKLVSVLFADLVDFTAHAEQLDPEDVVALLRPYHTAARAEIDRYGGTIEKFAGDAVMAVFGAPTAHEDDAERAVRAGLGIVEAVERLNVAQPALRLAVRVAIETGGALVDLAARPEAGEAFVAGDVVNTASRLQHVAPVNGVVAGETTVRATKHVVDYEPLDPVALKGKADPVAVWRVIEIRRSTPLREHRAPLVGRDDDLELLRQTFARTVRESSVQLVTITGEPGVGKTRLVAELRDSLEGDARPIGWRQGRCLPYGDGITFWALGEIVKSEAGILESDSPARAADKIMAAVVAAVDDATEHEWFVARLAALVGVAGAETGSADRSESFTAWRRFVEGIAGRAPLVLVVEDLHWADAALLEFLDHLVDWATDVPVLVVCTARPEFYERQPAWGGGKRNSTTIGLSPLTAEETARLVSALLSQAVLPADTQALLLEHAGGNPLYAEEFARMLVDRGVLERRNGAIRVAVGATIAVPETIQALIAARLDGLPARRKALLHDAAVLGKTFWAGGVAAMSGSEPSEVRDGLHELARKEFVRAARSSSVHGQEEYSFWHVLVRDVAYGQIPRAARARKHEAAAAWIERISEDRVTDHAEFLAHHYLQALELARAVGAEEDATRLEVPAVEFLVLAGDRALPLDVRNAEEYYRRALERLLPGNPNRARVLAKAAEAAWLGGRLAEAERDCEEAIAAFRVSGNAVGQSEAMVVLAAVLKFRGETTRAWELIAHAVELLERAPPGPALVRAYAQLARDQMLLGHLRDCLKQCEKTLALAEEHGMKEQIVFVLQMRGSSRCGLLDFGGLDDLREARRRALELGLAQEIARSHNNLGSNLLFAEGPASAHDVFRAGMELAERRGLTSWVHWGKAHTLWTLFDLGRWDELLEVADELIDWDRRHGRTYNGPWALAFRAAVLLWHGNTAGAKALVGEFLPAIREIGDPQVLVPALAIAATIESASGDAATALALVREFDAASARDFTFRTQYLPDALQIAAGARDERLVESLLAVSETSSRRGQLVAVTVRAIEAERQENAEEAAGLFCEAAEGWKEFGVVLAHGRMLLGAGRCLLALGRQEAAGEALEAARTVFGSLRAARLLEEVESLLAVAA